MTSTPTSTPPTTTISPNSDGVPATKVVSSSPSTAPTREAQPKAAAAVVDTPRAVAAAAAPTPPNNIAFSSVFDYHVVTLQRHSLKAPWGLSLSYLDGVRLVVSHTVPATHNAATIQSHWKVRNTTNPWIFWPTKQTTTSTSASTSQLLSIRPNGFVRNLAAGGHGAWVAQASPEALLRAGDAIISINNVYANEFRNLEQATNLFKQLLSVQLVVLRTAAAHQRAVQQIQQQQRQNQPTTSGTPADRANLALRAIPRPPPLPPVVARPGLFPTGTYQPRYYTTAPPPPKPVIYRNKLFKNDKREPLEYVDNGEAPWDPEERNRLRNFLAPAPNSQTFPAWLQARKQAWRKNYNVHPITPDPHDSHNYYRDCEIEDRLLDCEVALDFWRTSARMATFDEWLRRRKVKWRTQYSWNKRKHELIVQDVDRPVSLYDVDGFSTWLRVRKNQWKVERRKRQRRTISTASTSTSSTSTTTDGTASLEEMAAVNAPPHAAPTSSPSPGVDTQVSSTAASAAVVTPSPPEMPDSTQEDEAARHLQPEMLFIDEFLAKQELEQQRRFKERPLFRNIDFVFDAALGCPDDVVLHLFRFLSPVEHSKMLSISQTTRERLTQRGEVFRQLCPSHWKLPRKPRRPWHELYLVRLRKETIQSRKVLDEVLAEASELLLRGDQFHAVEKLVQKAERDCDNFDINYTSGVVCERNSILNLATIHQRTKVIKWLVEQRGADIETADRGQFTPLLNAAWAGDKSLVRYFMQQGANRKQVGTCHYTKPLALPDFQGLTAEGWALKRGHTEVAKLIRLGL